MRSRQLYFYLTQKASTSIQPVSLVHLHQSTAFLLSPTLDSLELPSLQHHPRKKANNDFQHNLPRITLRTPVGAKGGDLYVKKHVSTVVFGL